ncbi:hypothetical protein OURE66S_03034 [Oligella ureolytica]
MAPNYFLPTALIDASGVLKLMAMPSFTMPLPHIMKIIMKENNEFYIPHIDSWFEVHHRTLNWTDGSKSSFASRA